MKELYSDDEYEACFRCYGTGKIDIYKTKIIRFDGRIVDYVRMITGIKDCFVCKGTGKLVKE